MTERGGARYNVFIRLRDTGRDTEGDEMSSTTKTLMSGKTATWLSDDEIVTGAKVSTDGATNSATIVRVSGASVVIRYDFTGIEVRRMNRKLYRVA